MNHLRADLLRQNLHRWDGIIKWLIKSHLKSEILEMELLQGSYLIQSVVGGDGDGVGVHHQPLPQQREQTVRVHDLHLPPAGKKNTRGVPIMTFLTALK